MNNAVQVIRVALLSDIRNVVSYTKKRREHMAPCIDGQRKEWLKCHILPCFLALLAELEAAAI